jgi:hypothetical protein
MNSLWSAFGWAYTCLMNLKIWAENIKMHDRQYLLGCNAGRLHVSCLASASNFYGMASVFSREASISAAILSV